MGEGIVHNVSHSTLGGVEGGGWLTCIIHRVSPSTMNGGGGAYLHHSQCHSLGRVGAHLHRQSVSLYLGWSGRVGYLHHP